ncbi:hypothetical protein EIN_027460 [Entamoeba invadens IP1]|uniref:hypothetical protein n=1 Tax=Entamoeba invadens IP1 TaxID=370355 RepID=UPI0002C3E4A1|nr:hypothetical protein EIN_027460 [Entamoeba invadens IP1]ELP90827.1 hypothetical protein EIN_027460 [Entamoeba invadens IP1]|eukprot:XP_004257598.1 hypothetical protein EIN_027460 [Entamoeba invadens IP1]
MNSSYGKTNQKPIKTDLVYKQISVKNNKGDIQYDADRYLKKNSLLVKSFYDVAENIRCFECNKSFDDFFVPNLIGVQTLTMSKRIMNEVMCLAEDLNIPIYYQDTDSMDVLKSRITELEDEYYKKYNRVLRGSDMGQFHPDFDELSGDVTKLYKKLYDGESFNLIFYNLEHHLNLLKILKLNQDLNSVEILNLILNWVHFKKYKCLFQRNKNYLNFIILIKIKYTYNNRDKLFGVHFNTDSKHNLKNFYSCIYNYFNISNNRIQKLLDDIYVIYINNKRSINTSITKMKVPTELNAEIRPQPIINQHGSTTTIATYPNTNNNKKDGTIKQLFNVDMNQYVLSLDENIYTYYNNKDIIYSNNFKPSPPKYSFYN